VRNFNIDLTRMPATSTAIGFHWQVGQATSIEYVNITMSQDPATNHQGIYMEDGSGGVLSDLEFVGGRLGVLVGNQQFTVRNVSFSNAQIAIQAVWNWGWTWQNVYVRRRIPYSGLNSFVQTNIKLWCWYPDSNWRKFVRSSCWF
jgi:glucan 1,3-beta-glucosidase